MRDMKSNCYTGIRTVASAPCDRRSSAPVSCGRPTPCRVVARPHAVWSPDPTSCGCPRTHRVPARERNAFPPENATRSRAGTRCVPAGAWEGVTAEIKIARRAYILIEGKDPAQSFPAGDEQKGCGHSPFSIHNLIGGKTLISQSSLSGNEEAFQSRLFPYSICINKGIRDVCVRVFGLLRGLIKIRAFDDETSEGYLPFALLILDF